MASWAGAAHVAAPVPRTWAKASTVGQTCLAQVRDPVAKRQLTRCAPLAVMARVLNWVATINDQSRGARRGNNAAHQDKPGGCTLPPNADGEGWTVVKSAKKPRPPSPAPSTASATSSIFSSGSGRSGRSQRSRASSHSTASTRYSGTGRRRPRPSDVRDKIDSLGRSSRLEGRVTGVHGYGAFIDIGVGKDGLLRCPEVEWLARRRVHDMRELVSVGDTLPMLFVLDYDEGQGRLTLTCRPPPEAMPQVRPHAAPSSRLSESTTDKATMAPPRSCVDVGKEGDVRQAPAKDASTSPPPSSPMPSLDATAKFAHAGVLVSRAGHHGPTAAAVLCGEDAVPRDCVDKPPRVVAKVRIRGVLHVLYDLPWKGASYSSLG